MTSVRILREIFERACDLEPDERPGFLDEVCPDEALRRRVDALLAADERGARAPERSGADPSG